MAYDGTLKFDTSLNADGMQKGLDKMGSIVKGAAVFTLLEKGLGAVSNAMDAAVARVDTLNKFPRVMEQMGYGADTAQKSITRLSDGIQGLPTTLDSIVGSTQRLAIATGSLDKGTDTALALNNALLASGASSEAASRGTEQYIQALSRGKIDAQEWKTLMETMPYAMQQVAEAFGFAGPSAIQQLQTALSGGEITMTQFNDKLIALNSGIGGFAEVAQTASGGIATSWTNIQTAVVRGTANVIQAVDSGLAKFGGIAGIMDSVKGAVDKAFAAISSAANVLMQNLDKVALAAVGVGTAFASYKAIQAWNTAAKEAATVSSFLEETNQQLTLAIGKSKASQLEQVAATKLQEAQDARARYEKLELIATEKLSEAAALKEAAAKATGAEATQLQAQATQAATVAEQAQTAATAASTVSTAADTAAVQADVAAQNARNTSVGLGTALIGYLTGSLTLHQLATAAATAATTLFTIALNALPLFAIIAAVAALVVGIIALISWLSSGSEEYQKQKEELEDLTKAHKEYEKQLEADKDAADQAIAKTKAQSVANDDLAANLRNLMATNDKAGSNNAAIARTVDQLNKSVEGLGLAYDETTGKLNTSIDMMEAYIKAQGEISAIKAQEEEYNRLLGEQLELQAKIRVEEERQKVLAQQLADRQITQREYNELIWRSNNLIKEYGKTEQQMAADVKAAHAAINTAAKESATAQINAYEAINGARDAEGNNLRQLAKLYSTTTDEILAEMAEQGLSMEEWSAKKAEMFTKEGQSLQGVANQWGMTTDEVIAYMDEWGMTLDEFAAEMEATHTKEGLSLEQLAEKWGTTTDVIESEMDNMGMSMQEWSDRQQEWSDKQQEIWEGYKETVTSAFDEVKDSAVVTVDEMLENLEKSQEQFKEWSDGLNALAERGLDQGLIEQLRKAGPSARGQVKELVDASDEEIKKLNGKFDAGAKLATEAVKAEFSDPNFIAAGSDAFTDMGTQVNNNTDLQTAAKTAIDETKTDVETAINNANFPNLGESISEGIADGIRRGQSSVINAAVAAVRAAYDAAKKEGGINSPAKKFMPLGLAIDEGIALPIEEAKATKAAAADSMNGLYKIMEALTGGAVFDRLNAMVAANPFDGRVLAMAGAYTTNISGDTNSGGDTNNWDIDINLNGGIESSVDVRRIGREIGREVERQCRDKGLK